ncbi:MAG TPA: VOC family protein [Methylococcaceae bacterium]|nr:VOC family protein [Methylococcaceae bacterium]
MNDPFKTHGAFSWCELLTTDVDAAKRFYGTLFGWTLEDVNMTGTTYTLVKTGEQGIGGIMQTPPQAAGAPPHWGAYVTVDDVDATAGKAVELGAKICVPPTDIPNVGRFCVLQDPQGAAISVITYMKSGMPQ